MSHGKKPPKKRKRHSPPPASARLSRRLEQLRSGRKQDLWADDDDDEDEPFEQAKKPTDERTYIILTDSESEESSPAPPPPSSKKTKKKKTTVRNASLQSDNDETATNRQPPKCTTCLICSILEKLSSHNCCSNHLGALSANNHRHHSHFDLQQPTTSANAYAGCLGSEQLQQLQSRSPGTRATKKTTARGTSTRKVANKKMLGSDQSETEQPSSHANNTSELSAKSSRVKQVPPARVSASTIVIEPVPSPTPAPMPNDTTFTVAASTSATSVINSFESPTIFDTGHLQQSSDQPVTTNDDSGQDIQQQNTSTKSSDENNTENKQHNPQIPISEELLVVHEIVLDGDDPESPTPTEFTPATARRMMSADMAPSLPKVPLKQGRFRLGKPINNDTVTIANAANEYRPMASQTSSSSSPKSATSIVINNRPPPPPPPTMETIVEDEPSVTPAVLTILDGSMQPSSNLSTERQESSQNPLTDTMMSNLFGQQEATQIENIPTTTVSPNELAPTSLSSPLAPIAEESNQEIEASTTTLTSVSNISQSSILTNDQCDSQRQPPSPVYDRTTPKRISHRVGPDGLRVSISRPPLPASHPSPLTTPARRKTSTDVAPFPTTSREQM